MGKLRFTITFILFWVIIIFSCLLAENFALLSSDHMGGMNMTSLYLLTFFIIFMLVFYYFKERKHNQIKVDKILLPIIAIFGLVSILTVWWQGPREFVNPDDGFTTAISFSFKQKMSYTLQIVVWCAVLYGLLFINNRYSISRKWLAWLPFVYAWGVVTCSVVDFFMEFKSIVGIFDGTYTGSGITFIVYNANVWGHLLLVGLFSFVILSLKKFRLPYYFAMVHLFIMIIFTSCATAFFAGIVVLFAYSLYEILSLFNAQRRKSVKYLIIYLSSLGLFFMTFGLMVLLKVPLFDNFWRFISKQIIEKDYSTLTSRTDIWSSIFKLLSQNPVDLIFGLGYKTGNAIFTQYFLAYNNHEFAIRSAHNGIMEIFLRHGIIGIAMYMSSVVLYVYGAIRLLKRKQYRVVYFYVICIGGLIVHSVAESTMLFTPNIGGTYATLVFFLPIANETKRKYFMELNADLQQAEIGELKHDRKSFLYFINIMTMGIIIALSVSLAIGYLNHNVSTLVIYLVLIALSVASLFAASLIFSKLGKISFKESLMALIVKPIKDNYISLLIAFVPGLTCAFVLPLIGSFDLFASLLYTLCVFVLFNFAYSLLHKPENNLTLEIINNQFTFVLRNVSSEVPYEQK